MCKTVLVIFLVIIFHAYGNEEYVTRNTKYGLIRGVVKSSRVVGSSTKFYYFSGIPYAKPPVGKLRFQAPVPLERWEGVKDAIKLKPICTQYFQGMTVDQIVGDEDCLYLDLATPKRANDGKLPVLVWIHGGGFTYASRQQLGPDTFMEESVVVVQIEYRLNVFGFLSTQDEYAMGNAGLKDQVAALEWVRDNIVYFGGDPGKVTIFGSSAGGSSVQLHMLFHKSRDLFHRAISESGTPLNPWSFQRDPLETTLRLAKGLGIRSNDSQTIVDRLQKVSAEDLLSVAYNESIVGPFLPLLKFAFLPSIEKESPTAFITARAFKLLEKNVTKIVPYMMGYNTEEGSYPYLFITRGRVDFGLYEERPELMIPTSMNIAGGSLCETQTVSKIRKYYFDNGPFNVTEYWINYMGYQQFILGILKSTEFICQARQYPLYFYKFSYEGSHDTSVLGGAGHYVEVFYLLYPDDPIWRTNETESDRLTRRRMVKMWTNFATWGNPTPYEEPLLQNVRWPTFCGSESYLDIGSDLLLARKPDKKHVQFWNDQFEKCGYPPYYTY
ncbi:hypothetical protein RI129_007807 [Pyrocoelia pectoralis]|uniref:Carboxylic ester hydrolase n=1 Tax=Pyrocoelia pectoralis TaxID=417401 RepID=A0AAN7VAC1_9COLE